MLLAGLPGQMYLGMGDPYQMSTNRLRLPSSMASFFSPRCFLHPEDLSKGECGMSPQLLKAIELHRDYWERRSMSMPLVSFHIGDTLVSRQFQAARPLLRDHVRIGPEMITVEDFIADYERMWRESEATGQNGIFTAEPFTGIPWMEAMLGCAVYGSVGALLTEPCMSTVEQLQGIRLDADDPWLGKYLEFTRKLVTVSAGRFPVGQPIMRGPSDIVGALVGQSTMVLLMADFPDQMRSVFQKVAEIFLDVIRRQQREVPAYHGGASIGFYHLWTPGKCIWFQEDLSALLSPDYYSRFLKGADELICHDHDYTVVHLHPSSFFLLDQLLGIGGLSAIEVNKDIGGPSVERMIPVLARIQQEKNLVVWGELSQQDVDTILDELPDHRVALSILSPSVERAAGLMDHVRSRTTRG